MDAEVEDLKRRADRLRPSGGRSYATAEFPFATRRDALELAECTVQMEKALACLKVLPRRGMGRVLCMDSLLADSARCQIIEARAQGKRPPIEALRTLQERRMERR